MIFWYLFIFLKKWIWCDIKTAQIINAHLFRLIHLHSLTFLKSSERFNHWALWLHVNADVCFHGVIVGNQDLLCEAVLAAVNGHAIKTNDLIFKHPQSRYNPPTRIGQVLLLWMWVQTFTLFLIQVQAVCKKKKELKK